MIPQDRTVEPFQLLPPHLTVRKFFGNRLSRRSTVKKKTKKTALMETKNSVSAVTACSGMKYSVRGIIKQRLYCLCDWDVKLKGQCDQAIVPAAFSQIEKLFELIWTNLLWWDCWRGELTSTRVLVREGVRDLHACEHEISRARAAKPSKDSRQKTTLPQF